MTLNRQRRYQVRHQAAGLCHQCNQPATEGARCAKCAEAQRQSTRERKNVKPWKPGGVGRRPAFAPLNWEGVDWTRSNAEIGRVVGCTKYAVRLYRLKSGIAPYKRAQRKYRQGVDFKAEVARFTAAEIVTILECPRAKAQQWIDGTRRPPEWQQRHWLDILHRAKGEMSVVKNPAKGRRASP